MLSFKHEVFLEVARHLSFTKASQVLFISQPAISRHIQQLEEQYKSSLFERKGNSIILSGAGKILLVFLTRARDIEKQLEYEISAHRDKLNIKGELRLGASTTVALYIVPPVLSIFRAKHPEVAMSLINRNSENVMKALLDHEIDVGIVEGKGKMNRVITEPFLIDEVIPVCSARSYLAKRARFTIKDLKTIPVALRERGSGTLAAVKQALGKQGIKLSDLKISMRLGGTEALKNFVLADDSLGFLPMRAVAKELSSGDLIRISFEKLSINHQFYFVWRQGYKIDGLSSTFVRLAKNYYNIKL